MLSIKDCKIEYTGNTEELLVDVCMILDFAFDMIKTEKGQKVAEKYIIKIAKIVVKKKRK